MSGSTSHDDNVGNKQTATGNTICPWLVYIQCFFVSIASILGTGILGLPVKLWRCGMKPFLLIFSACFGIQLLIVVFFTDLIQRSHARLLLEQKRSGIEAVPLVSAMDKDDEASDGEEEQVTPASHPTPAPAPSLTLLARHFLPRPLELAFNADVLLHFIVTMLTYCLAAGKEFSSLLQVHPAPTTAVFGLTVGLFAILGSRLVHPFVSVLTLAKASLLVAVVGAAIAAGLRIGLEPQDNFAAVAEPFLMCTLALGGVINIMPMLFGLLPRPTCPRQVAGFRRSVCAAMCVCFLLNVAWSWAVLSVVPQTCVEMDGRNASCDISLSRAEQLGQPSTIPLQDALLQDSQLAWVAVFVQVFIIISIGVSFLTYMAAFTHTIDGLVVYVIPGRCRLPDISVARVVTILSLLSIIGVAMLRPNSFVVVLERVVSLFLNLECGPFVFLMVLRSQMSKNKQLQIPLPLPTWLIATVFAVLLFGLAALGIDLSGVVASLRQQHNLTNINATLTELKE